MDINKYILNQIKQEENLISLSKHQSKKSYDHQDIKQPKSILNNVLLNKINDGIQNQKRLTNHYKSIATGRPIIQEDDNIRLINSNVSLDTNLENQFYYLMSKYIKDQTQLTDLYNNITPNMLAELVHNFAMYEPEIRKFRGQYIDNKVFADKIRNMLLKNVNLKYPAAIPLNNAMDASNQPDVAAQEAFEAKNNKANEKHSLSDAPLGKLEFIIGAFGKSKEECSKYYELWDEVVEFLTTNFLK